MMATATANGKPVERATQVRVLLILMLFLLSAVAFLDRTNISVAGVQMRDVLYRIGDVDDVVAFDDAEPEVVEIAKPHLGPPSKTFLAVWAADMATGQPP